MSYATQHALVNDVQFRGRVAMGLAVAARYMLIEDPGTPNHTIRRALGVVTLQDPAAMVSNFIYEIAANPIIVAAGPVDSLDATIDFVIGQTWDVKAGTV